MIAPDLHPSAVTVQTGALTALFAVVDVILFIASASVNPLRPTVMSH